MASAASQLSSLTFQGGRAGFGKGREVEKARVALPGLNQRRRERSMAVVSAAGDVAAEGTTYLIAGAIAIALVGTAFPILFSRKDLCPECDGAGFIRKSGVTLRANAARKDQAQIVCPNCNGLGKLGQIDK